MSENAKRVYKIECICKEIIRSIIEGCEEVKADLNTIDAVFNFSKADVEKGTPENFAIKWINPKTRKKYYVTVIITDTKE